ncbi:hypothetical protein KKH18_00175 [bacterium]|nr:hypothetical protein [bacterium]
MNRGDETRFRTPRYPQNSGAGVQNDRPGDFSPMTLSERSKLLGFLLGQQQILDSLDRAAS